jgi:hypothetical protein
MSEIYTPDNLGAGGTQTISETAIILSGSVLTRGEIVAKITATGKIVPLNTAATDGSEVPFGIMADDAPDTGADSTKLLYLAGEFNESAVTAATSTPAAQKANLRVLGIYLKTSILGA